MAESLRKNKTLKILKLDMNKITIVGFSIIQSSLRLNSNLASIEFPINDFQKALITLKEPLKRQLYQSYFEIENLLNKNRNNTGSPPTTNKVLPPPVDNMPIATIVTVPEPTAPGVYFIIFFVFYYFFILF